MVQPNDADQTQEVPKHPAIVTMFYGSLFVYALIIIVVLGTVLVRAS